MQLVGTDTDFGTQAVLETIGKAGRGVDHHRTGIHFAQKATCTRNVFSNDYIGML